MSSYQVSQDNEWCFDGASMPSFTPSPLTHRTETFPMEVIDPQDYYQRMASVQADTEQCMDGANFLVNPNLVSPASILPSTWANELTNNTTAFGRGTSTMASFTAAAATPMSASISMSTLQSTAPMFAPIPQSTIVSALAARRMGHRASQSEHHALPKTPLQISTSHHHRSRSSVHSIPESPALFSPFAVNMSRSLSTASSATDLSDLLVSPSRPTNSRKASAKSARSLVHKAETIEPTGAANMVRIKSMDGTSREVGVLPRTAKHVHSRSQGSQKLLCDNCNEVPDGFRGEHELMRHYNLRHAPRRKAFICIEPPGQEGFFAQVGCRSCKEKKLYGAYYNAAAHLRRVHFDPRPRGRKAKGTERRGGKAGGNNPPMDVLKTHWIREVDVANTNHPNAGRTRNLDDAEDFEEDSNEDDLDAQLPRRGSNHGSRTSSTSSTSSDSHGRAGSDDEATLLSSSVNGDSADGVPSFDLSDPPQASLPYPPFITTTQASSKTTSIDSSPMTQDTAATIISSPLSWQHTITAAAPFGNDAAGGIAWSEGDAQQSMFVAQLSPGFEALDSAFTFMHQQPDLYMNNWS